MSTLRTRTRLPIRSPFVGLALAISFFLVGCSSTSELRTGGASKAQTFLSVGDKPMPVVSGEPGSTVAADSDPSAGTLRRPKRQDARISGRVFDADGRPVPSARVRLADGAAPGGPVVAATTDRSGAFTLRGLRPGSDYTVIAEWKDATGALTGRANARAADTDVRIDLVDAGSAPPARAAGPSRVDRVSDREAVEDDRDAADGPGSLRSADRVNEEDLPPAAPAEPLGHAAADPEVDRDPARSDATTRPVSTTWGRGPHRPAPAAADAAADPATPGRAESMTPDDDVPNPLPPALEPAGDRDQAAAGRPPLAPEPAPVAAADPFAEPLTPALNTRPLPGTGRPSAAPLAFASPSRPTPTTLPAEPPAESVPGAIVVEPETFAPVVDRNADRVSTPGATAASSATDPFAPSTVAPVAASIPDAPVPPAEVAASSAPSGPAQASGPRKRKPTWGEVAATATALPPLEGVAATGTARSKTDVGVARRSLAVATDGPTDRSVTGPAGPAREPRMPFCDYDDRHRQIIDFCLPDLEGKPVRFRDLNADLVLIDFWGTWCAPCIRSIPHLVDLQQRMGTRLVVVGIACEPDAQDVATPRVAAKAAKLHVNYPVLVSRNDGSCPLQEALHVGAFPTMVLVDRQGRVLWRDQGATQANLARLDRFLASAPSPDGRAVR